MGDENVRIDAEIRAVARDIDYAALLAASGALVVDLDAENSVRVEARPVLRTDPR